jgi:TonB family protein
MLCLGAALLCGCEGYAWNHQERAPRPSSNACDQLIEIRRVLPIYPREAALDEIQGFVALRYHVAPTGDVFNVRVVAADPHEELLAQASVAALVQWKYAPSTYPVRNCHLTDYYVLRDRGRTTILQRPSAIRATTGPAATAGAGAP